MRFYDGISFPLANKTSGASWKAKVPQYYGLQYNYAGAITVRLNNEEPLRLEGPWVFFTHPRGFFEYGSSDTSRHGCYICFFGPRVDKYIREGLLSLENGGLAAWRISDAARYMRSADAFLEAFKSGKCRPERLALMFEDLLLQLHEQEVQPSRTMEWHHAAFRALLDKVDKTPGKEWDFDREGAAMGLSKSHFRRLFQQFASAPPGQYLIRRRLEKAARLLVETSEQVSSVARLSGFGNEFYFSRLFKRRYALPPLQYRKEMGA